MVRIHNPRRRRSRRRRCRGAITRALRRHRCAIPRRRRKGRRSRRSRSLAARRAWAHRRRVKAARGPLSHLVPSRMLAANPRRRRRRRRSRNDVRRVSWRTYPGVYNPRRRRRARNAYYISQYGMNPGGVVRAVKKGFSPSLILNHAVPIIGGVLATSVASGFVTPMLPAVAQGGLGRGAVQIAMSGPTAALLGLALPRYASDFLLGGVMAGAVTAIRSIAPGSQMFGCRGMGCYQGNQTNPATPFFDNAGYFDNAFFANHYWDNPLSMAGMAGMNDFLVARQAANPENAPTMDPEFPRIAELG